MILTEEELAMLERVLPAAAERYKAEQVERAAIMEDDDEPVVFVDQPISAIVTESGEARDADTVLPADVCPACERGSPRRGAPHTCGLPSPYYAPREGA